MQQAFGKVLLFLLENFQAVCFTDTFFCQGLKLFLISINFE